MPIQRTISPDLSTGAVCNFLNTLVEKKYSEEESCKNEWMSNGFEFVEGGSKSILPQRQSLFMTTFFSKKAEVISVASGRRHAEVDVICPIGHELELNICALLFIKKGKVSNSVKDQILDIFMNTVISEEHIDDAETDLIRAGVGIGDYQVVLFFELWRRRRSEISSDTDNVNLQALKTQTEELRDAAGNQIFRVRISEQIQLLCNAPSNTTDHENQIEVGDIDNPIKEIADAIRRREELRRCDGIEIVNKQIGNKFYYKEWKIEWEIRSIKTGRCTICKLHLPITYFRKARKTLWATVVVSGSLKPAIEKMVLGCIEDAAITTGIVIVLTGGMGLAAAITVFSVACWACLEKKFPETLECILPSLYLATERDEWREGI